MGSSANLWLGYHLVWVGQRPNNANIGRFVGLHTTIGRHDTNFRSTRSTVRSNGRVVVLWFSHGVWHHRCPKFPLVGWWGIWRNPFNREMMIDGIPNWLAPLFLPKGHYSLTCCLFCNLLSKTQTFNFFPTQRGPLYRKINTAILVSYWYFTWTYLVADKLIV